MGRKFLRFWQTFANTLFASCLRTSWSCRLLARLFESFHFSSNKPYQTLSKQCLSLTPKIASRKDWVFKLGGFPVEQSMEPEVLRLSYSLFTEKNNFFMSENAREILWKKRLQKVSNFDLKMWYLSKTGPDDSIYIVFDFGYKPIVWNLHGGQFSTLSLLQHRGSSWRKKTEEVTLGYLSGQINFGDLFRKNVQNKTLSENTDENRFTLEQVIPML